MSTFDDPVSDGDKSLVSVWMLKINFKVRVLAPPQLLPPVQPRLIPSSLQLEVGVSLIQQYRMKTSILF